MVLCKAVDPARASFRFYTGLDNRKGAELARNPQAAIVFYWHHLSRQVRIVGRTEPAPRAEVEAYFASRPAASRAAAHASRQSHPVASREELERQTRAAAEADGRGADELPPEDWGGYDIVADELEFWQGRAGRLHDRVAYMRDGSRALDRFDPGELDGAATTVTDAHGTRWVRTRLQP
jgi:pyridoxamine 5'-phosphate oxidase